MAVAPLSALGVAGVATLIIIEVENRRSIFSTRFPAARHVRATPSLIGIGPDGGNMSTANPHRLSPFFSNHDASRALSSRGHRTHC
jgi:hypothetical protein